MSIPSPRPGNPEREPGSGPDSYPNTDPDPVPHSNPNPDSADNAGSASHHPEPVPAPTPAPTLRRHPWLTAAVVLTAIFLGLCRFHTLTDANDRLNAFPDRGPAFASRAIPQDPAEQAVIGEARLMKKLCQTATQQVTLSVIDGTKNRHATHDPAYCLRGAGWAVSETSLIAIPGGEGTLLTLTKEGKSTQAAFWFSDGATRHSSPVKHWWHSAVRRLTFGRSEPAPVLVMIFPTEGTSADWPKLWKEIPELWSL
ncbi:MAG: hypothetical protein JWL81_2902 [Verrucomicrobiales bacterium]|nr:hypothetical protein [Verrucomicrobiales bacterium]